MTESQIGIGTPAGLTGPPSGPALPAARRSCAAPRSQAPEVVPWHRRVLGRFHVTGVFWYRLHLFGVTILPRWLVPPVVLGFTLFFFLVLRRIRVAVIRNLEPVLGPSRWGWPGRQYRAWRTLWNHAWCMTETYEGLGPGRGVEVETEGEEIWRELACQPRGVIVVTAHVGHWEVGSRLPEARAVRRVHVVREPELDADAQEFLSALLRRQCGEGVEFHYSRSGDPALGLRLLGALRQGQLVAVQGDRPRAGARAHRAQLFGMPFDLPAGPVILARAAGAPLLPLFVFRTGRSCSRVVFRAPVWVAQTEDREADLEVAVQTLADQLQWAIRREPHQWFCFRDLW